ncbi:MAG: hypothetical protein GY742_20390 [Hyphomicrobiales bacterium]|nr:hypothetical protein [Hyphomicrobiales bacterium]
MAGFVILHDQLSYVSNHSRLGNWVVNPDDWNLEMSGFNANQLYSKRNVYHLPPQSARAGGKYDRREGDLGD